MYNLDRPNTEKKLPTVLSTEEENGTDLRYIQALLGQESPKTTQIYTHITTKSFEKIKSPLDDLIF